MNSNAEPGYHSRETPPKTPPDPAPGHSVDAAGASLSPRGIVLLNMATAGARDRTGEMAENIKHALTLGIKPQGIVDVLDQAAQLAGHPHQHQLTILADVLREVS